MHHSKRLVAIATIAALCAGCSAGGSDDSAFDTATGAPALSPATPILDPVGATTSVNPRDVLPPRVPDTSRKGTQPSTPGTKEKQP